MTNDLFGQINVVLLDLQRAQMQTYERPLKKLAGLLHHEQLEAFNAKLVEGVNLQEFLDASERTGGGMVGSHKLVWPDDEKQELGLTLLLIDKFAADPGYAANFGYHYYYSGSRKVVSGIHSLTAQLLIPFVREYKTYVQNKGVQKIATVAPASNEVFIVHGHDDAALQGLARFLERLGLKAIVLKEQPDRGRTIIEKFEQSAHDVGFAVVLLTPDDLGGAVKSEKHEVRARQNVIFELGYFAGKLGRGRVCLLRKGDIEIPSDLFGVIYTDMDTSDGWKSKLVGELKAAGLEFDANHMWG